MAIPEGSVPPMYPWIYDSLDQLWDLHHSTSQNSDIIGTYISCGVSVLSAISKEDPERIVAKVLYERASCDNKKIREAFVIWSDKDHDGQRGGNALCKYIKDKNLGDVLEMGPRMNPNTGNMIKVWVWAPPHKSLHPNDKAMPVYGKKLVRRHLDGPQEYVDTTDTRFDDNRFAREA